MVGRTCRTGFAVIALSAIASTSAIACGGVGFVTPEELVARAQFIVIARAERLLSNQTAFQFVPTHIQFAIIAPIKGALSTHSVTFTGVFENRDDPNDRAVPFDFIRPGGCHGNCFALAYRQDAEYLLFLRRSTVEDGRGEMTPYWASLAPTNEQISGDNDEWVRWVTQQIRHPSLAPRVADVDRAAYAGIQDAKDWRNPKITIRAEAIEVESDSPPAYHATVSASELTDVLVALPPKAWPYGRVVKVSIIHLRRPGGSDDNRSARIVTRQRKS